MDDTEKEKLKQHNRRVRDAAKQLPTKGLQDSFKALAYRADKNTSNAKGCTVHGWSMAGISKLSRKGGYYRSTRQLWRDIKTFEDMGLAIREAGQRGDDGRQEPSVIMLRFGESVAEDYRPTVTDAYRPSEPRSRASKPERSRHEPNELPHHCAGCLALYPSELAKYIAGDLTDNDIGHIYAAHRVPLGTRSLPDTTCGNSHFQ